MFVCPSQLSRRYCFVTLKDDAPIEEVKASLSAIPFGSGFVTAELKNSHRAEAADVEAKDIDPYTIYVGNLPNNVSVRRVKELFPNSVRIDIGYAQRMKYTRYAFVRYNTVEESIDGFRSATELHLGPRSLVVRFRRLRGNMELHEAIDVATEARAAAAAAASAGPCPSAAYSAGTNSDYDDAMSACGDGEGASRMSQFASEPIAEPEPRDEDNSDTDGQRAPANMSSGDAGNVVNETTESATDTNDVTATTVIDGACPSPSTSIASVATASANSAATELGAVVKTETYDDSDDEFFNGKEQPCSCLSTALLFCIFLAHFSHRSDM